MLKDLKSAAAVPALVLMMANAAMAANDYHIMCTGPNNTGFGTMTASAAPTQYEQILYNLCGYKVYVSKSVSKNMGYCQRNNIALRLYRTNQYSKRLCTVGG